MTEQTLSQGGTAVAEPPAPFLPGDGEDGGDGANRRKLVLVGAGLAVLVLLVAAFFLLKGHGSNPTPTGAVVHHTPVSSTAKQAGQAAKPLKLPKVYKGHVGRDPFKPLYVAPAPAPSQAPSTAPATGTTGTTGTTGGTPTTQKPATLGHPVWVELVSVNGTKSANFVVGYSNGKKLTTVWFRNVKAPTGSTPTVFAKLFSLLSIQSGEATIQFGDGTPIDIAPGAANRVVVN